MAQTKNIVIGSDHAGFPAKEYIKGLLARRCYRVADLGTRTQASVDYPDYGAAVGRAVARSRGRARGIVICGSGMGISMAANKIPGVRAALAATPRAARLSRMHNNANVLALAGRPYTRGVVRRIVLAWLTTPFEGGRHQRRIAKLSALDKR